MTTGIPTIGVEEEFFLVSRQTGHTTPIAAALTTSCPPGPVKVTAEFTPDQIEVSTGVCTDLDELHRQLTLGRSRIAELAEREDSLVIASGTPPLDEPAPPPLTDAPRYRWLTTEYRALAEAQGVCSCHVHVAVADQGTALQVSNHLRLWLPVLLACAANSPFCGGRDTGYASWRSVVWSRWPVSGAPPVWSSTGHHADLLGTLIETGVIADKRMAYWHARPSPRYPTIEIRVADVQRTSAEAVLLAALIRGLVMTAMADIELSRPVHHPSDTLTRAACWRAARDGMAGQGIDLHDGRLRPARYLMDRLVRHVRPALAHAGDLPFVTSQLARMRSSGSGAERQRAAYRRNGSLGDVVSDLAGALCKPGAPASL